MPRTINGIGTWYYGKRNVTQRYATCQFCGHEGILESYETGYYVVLFFIPVVPLGKRQVIDYCPRCTRHQVVPLEKWREFEVAATREATQRAEANPDDPAAAVQLLATLTSTRKLEQAGQYAEILADRFAEDPEVQNYLGSWFAGRGQEAKAEACFRRVLELCPENAEARRAVAMLLIARGEPDEACELLGLDGETAEPCDPKLLVMLADTYHAIFEHEKALHFYRLALAASPALANDARLRKRVRASEQALGRSETCLPPARRRWGVYLLVALAAVAVVGGALAINSYLRSHQTLHILNGWNQPVQVAIDGGPPEVVAPREHIERELSEGVHQARVRLPDGTMKTVGFQMRNGLLSRFARDRVFVLDAGAASSLFWEEVVYRRDEEALKEETPDFKLHYGQDFYTFDDIDYAFSAPPPEKQLQIERLVESHLGVLEDTPAAIVLSFSAVYPPGDLCGYAEHQLSLRPNDHALLGAYLAHCLRHDLTRRGHAFLKQGLGREPLAVEWHSYYQAACQILGKYEEMAAYYKKLRRQRPDDANVLFLAACVEPRRSDAMAAIEEALKLAPENPNASAFKALLLISAGDHRAARPHAEKAYQTDPEHRDYATGWFLTLLALKEYELLDAQLQAAARCNPSDSFVHAWRLRTLCAQGRETEAIRVNEEFTQRLSVGEGPAVQDCIVEAQLILDFLRGELETALARCRQLCDPALAAQYRFAICLNLDRPKEAEDALAQVQTELDGLEHLLLHLAWRRQGDEQRAQRHLQQAIVQLRTRSPKGRLAADNLAAGDQLKLEDVDEMVWIPETQMTLLLVLAGICPSHRQELLDRASRLVSQDLFSEPFLRRMLEEQLGHQ